MTQQPVTSPPTPEEPWTVRRVLEWTTAHLKKSGSDTPRLDAEILLAHARGCQRIQLYTQFDEPLNDAVRATMRGLVQRRAKAEPVAYLVGQREFFSLKFRVTRDVLIPRPETETLVIEILDAAKVRPNPTILDLCTGSGCVAISTAKNNPQAKVTAVDISRAAIAIARENAAAHQVTDRVEIIESNIFEALPAGKQFDLIVGNPPYIPSAEIDQLDAEVAKHEPRLALDGGPDGMDILRRIIEQAPRFAAPSALLLLEFTPEQAEALEQLTVAHGGYEDVSIVKDLGHRARVLKARIRAV
ncbi:peptide chain release factor N(5)-glutamine methyltransferase [Schlesneria paludicola]|uniref:peptide chain release factor N(5)-glutamine methyltransferase n=1 Tax=Schlesneria paludicola TaxID=360056 RepID=UPI0005910A30|nr:peptide chain release factor N(5)-glutamine methyltransferase [Schlesneria paludicola]